jgi:hypothetical protein
MTVAERVEELVKQNVRLQLTEQNIADMLFGQLNGYQQRVNSSCRRLVAEGRLVREGKGGPSDPYIYRLPPIKRRI